MELFAAIRRDARVEGCSIRELADKYHVHRRTVRQALVSAIPPPRRTPARTSPRLEPVRGFIDDMRLWVPESLSVSCDLPILVEEAADAVASLDLVDLGWCAMRERA